MNFSPDVLVLNPELADQLPAPSKRKRAATPGQGESWQEIDRQARKPGRVVQLAAGDEIKRAWLGEKTELLCACGATIGGGRLELNGARVTASCLQCGVRYDQHNNAS